MPPMTDDEPPARQPHPFLAEARAMVDKQLRRRGIQDPAILNAMLALPRHRFVPGVEPSSAYADRALPTMDGQTISQPYVTAWMTQWLGVERASRVLEVGTGSGYQTALLAMLGTHVVTVEQHGGLSSGAHHLLVELGVAHRVQFVVADGSLGYAAGAPYDRVLVTAAAAHLPAALRDQLVPSGAAVIPLGDRSEQRLTRITREGDRWRREQGLVCRFVPLVGADAWPST